MKNIKYSIIIPVYNVEKYLNKCIDSIINQSYKNFEIILVNDGSTDKSKKICEKYKKKYKNIFLIDKVNNGQASARNDGIKSATGDFIVFVDSDDYISDSNFLYKVNQKITDKIKCVIYGYKKVYENSSKTYSKPLFVHNKKSSILLELIEQNYFKGCPWDKIVQRKLIVENNLFFPEGKLSEDIEWSGKLLNVLTDNNIAILNENPYCYLQRKGSTTKTITNNHLRNIIDIFDELINLENIKNKKLLYSYIAYEYSMILGINKSKLRPKKTDKKLIKKLYEYNWILNYNYCNKVKKVKKIKDLFGIKLTSYILGIYINMKG